VIRCVDAGVVVKWLTPEDGTPAAEAVCLSSLAPVVRWVTPSFFWAEVGSVLRKKVRSGVLRSAEAALSWERLLLVPIRPVEGTRFWRAAWDWAERIAQPTLYDACYLAAAEVSAGPDEALEFWTADAQFVAALGAQRPPWVRLLADWPGPAAEPSAGPTAP
jgi:predicted nucleic acid-binding protein